MAAPTSKSRKSAASPQLVSVADADESVVRVLRQFRRIFNAVRTHFQQVERQSGVGGAQIWALSLIRAQPGIGVGALAAAMDVRQPTASNLVKSLSALDLIEVRREGEDRRHVQLYARPAGSRLLKRTPGPAAGVLPHALGSLEPAALRRLERDLGQLLKLLDTDGKAAKIPLSQM